MIVGGTPFLDALERLIFSCLAAVVVVGSLSLDFCFLQLIINNGGDYYSWKWD